MLPHKTPLERDPSDPSAPSTPQKSAATTLYRNEHPGDKSDDSSGILDILSISKFTKELFLRPSPSKVNNLPSNHAESIETDAPIIATNVNRHNVMNHEDDSMGMMQAQYGYQTPKSFRTTEKTTYKDDESSEVLDRKSTSISDGSQFSSDGRRSSHSSDIPPVVNTASSALKPPKSATRTFHRYRMKRNLGSPRRAGSGKEEEAKKPENTDVKENVEEVRLSKKIRFAPIIKDEENFSGDEVDVDSAHSYEVNNKQSSIKSSEDSKLSSELPNKFWLKDTHVSFKENSESSSDVSRKRAYGESEALLQTRSRLDEEARRKQIEEFARFKLQTDVSIKQKIHKDDNHEKNTTENELFKRESSNEPIKYPSTQLRDNIKTFQLNAEFTDNTPYTNNQNTGKNAYLQNSRYISEPSQQHHNIQPNNNQHMENNRPDNQMANSARIYVKNKLYTKIELMGRGGSAKVYKALHETQQLDEDGSMVGVKRVYAIKRVRLDGMDRTALKGFKNEISLLEKLKTEERVIEIIDYEITSSAILVVLEFGELDLAGVLSSRLSKKLDLAFVRYYAAEMFHCVAAVHKHDIVHSDLKPANFLLVKGMLKIIDFGIANAVPDHTVNIHRSMLIGTPNYMAPEALIESSFGFMSNISENTPIYKVGKPSDIWSCGCILYQMIYGSAPYAAYSGNQRFQAIMNPNLEISYPERGLGEVKVPTRAINVIRACLMRDPKKRLTASESLDTVFLNLQEELPRVSKSQIQDLLVGAIQYGAEQGHSVSQKSVREIIEKCWENVQAASNR